MTSRLIKQSLISATVITVTANIVGRFFGYFREAAIAERFGTSAVMDTFLVALTVPEILTFVVFAALPTAIVRTTRSQVETESAAEARLFWKGLSAIGLILAVLTGLCLIGQNHIVRWLAPGLAPEQQELAGYLLSILAGMMFFRGLEAYFRAWLFRRKHFVVPALSSFILNSIVIASLLIPFHAVPIVSLAVGWLAAAFALCSVNAWTAIGIIKPSLRVTPETVRVSPLLSMMMVVAIIEAAFLAFPAIDRYLALKYLGEGHIAALRYATFLSQLPPSVLVVTFSAATFPWITDMVVSDQARLRKFYQDSLRLVVFAILPIVVGLILFAEEIVRAAFSRGLFDDRSVELTVGPLICYAIGLVFYSTYFYQIRYYYARELFLRLGTIMAVGMAVKIIASLVLVRLYGHSGLALATSISWMTSTVIMTIDLARTANMRLSVGMIPWFLKVLLALAVTTGAWLVTGRIWPLPDYTALHLQLFYLIAVGGGGLLLFGGTALALGLPEMKRLRDLVFRRQKADQA